MMRFYYLLFTSAVLLACQKSSVDKKEEGLIRYKESLTLQDIPRATLTFFDVSDSRCPEGVQCIVAGSANVDLALDGVTTEGRITKHVKMCIGDCSNFLADTVRENFAGYHYRFILKAVNPLPRKDEEQTKTQYNISIDIKTEP